MKKCIKLRSALDGALGVPLKMCSTPERSYAGDICDDTTDSSVPLKQKSEEQPVLNPCVPPENHGNLRSCPKWRCTVESRDSAVPTFEPPNPPDELETNSHSSEIPNPMYSSDELSADSCISSELLNLKLETSVEDSGNICGYSSELPNQVCNPNKLSANYLDNSSELKSELDTPPKLSPDSLGKWYSLLKLKLQTPDKPSTSGSGNSSELPDLIFSSDELSANSLGNSSELPNLMFSSDELSADSLGNSSELPNLMFSSDELSANSLGNSSELLKQEFEILHNGLRNSSELLKPALETLDTLTANSFSNSCKLLEPKLQTPVKRSSNSHGNSCVLLKRKRETPAERRAKWAERQTNLHLKSVFGDDEDYTACKRLGASYCALPKTYAQPKCSGRTALCREVLNDTWVSFPTWSEDSTFVTSRKTQYEEYIYRCEDERFELDVVIETNAATIRVLEGVNKKMSRMSPEELSRFHLDDCLGGSSPTIHVKALRRIYGDKSADIVEGLKRNPSVAVPVVLRRLKAKEEEWREAQKGFNKIWREQNEKYYLKSLDHQGINFKQNDLKALRSKSLFNEIETIYDERHEQAEEGDGDGNNPNASGPHLILAYKDRSVLDDAANLLIHHVKRQTSIHKEDKQRIKQLLRHLIPDMFAHPRQQLSDDERDDDDEKEDVDMDSCTPSSSTNNNNNKNNNNSSTAPNSSAKSAVNTTSNSASSSTGSSSRGRKGETPIKKEPMDVDIKPVINSTSFSGNDDAGRTTAVNGNSMANVHPDESYTLFFGNNNWYLFLRLHQILCERLTRMYERAVQLAAEEARYRKFRKESIAVALRLKPKSEIALEDYYPAFLDMVKNVLDGNMDANAYEDTLREMFGIHAYIAFTLDKVVSYAVRQLQHLVSDETCQECVEVFQQESRRNATGGLCSTAHQRTVSEMLYQKRAEAALSDENCFKIYIYKKDCKVTIELLDTEGEEADPAQEVDKWSNYVERFANSGISGVGGSNQGAIASGDLHSRLDDDRGDLSDGDEVESYLESGLCGRRKPVFLPRNVRLWRRRSGGLFQSGRWGRSNETLSADVEIKTEKGEEGNSCSGNGNKRKDKADKSSSEEEKSPEGDRGKSSKVRANNSNAPSGGNPGELVASDNTQCRFNINQYRMVFVVNKENYLYKRQALQRAKQSHPAVSRKLSSKFSRWHVAWARDHIMDNQHRASVDWLMGRGEGVVPNRTRVMTDNDTNRPPYRAYNRYRVDRLGSSSQQVSSSSSLASSTSGGTDP